MKDKQQQAIDLIVSLLDSGKLLIYVGDDECGCRAEATILSVYAGDDGDVCIDVQDPFA